MYHKVFDFMYESKVFGFKIKHIKKIYILHEQVFKFFLKVKQKNKANI